MELSVPVAVCCALAAISALGVVLLRRPVHVALGLLGHSLSMAALYLTLSAQLMAVAQVLIYSGAIVVLFLIVVTLLPEGGQEKLTGGGLLLAVVSGVAVLAVLGGALAGFFAPGSTALLPVLTGEGPTVKEVGKPLFSTLVVPFELTAPLLLAAIVTAIALWRRQEKPRAGGLG
jgi:NADH-quinone oxidoreductase subunit J